MGTRPQHNPAYRRLTGRLREVREAAELTQRELARRLGKPHSFVWKCETGERRIDPIEFIGWCLACGIDPAAVLSEFTKVGRGSQPRA